MNPSVKRSQVLRHAAFSLIEVAAVMVILVLLITSGIKLLNGTSAHARRAGTELLAGMVDQARVLATTHRAYIILAIAEPGELPFEDDRCRLGLFKVDVEKWPAGNHEPVKEAVLLKRWQILETGVVLPRGGDGSMVNPMDVAEISLSIDKPKATTVKVHALVINPRGGLHLPAGSSPVVMQIAEGAYQRGGIITYQNGPGGNAVTRNRLRVGRVIARPYP